MLLSPEKEGLLKHPEPIATLYPLLFAVLTKLFSPMLMLVVCKALLPRSNSTVFIVAQLVMSLLFIFISVAPALLPTNKVADKLPAPPLPVNAVV